MLPVSEYDEKRWKDAVMYTKNQEKYLYRFLKDGNIPLDNGNAERCMNLVAQGKKAYLFSTSIDGAKVNMIIYSLVETARKNGANPYYYMKYILEKMPGHLDGKDRFFLAEMMPWSEMYRRYESRRTESAILRQCSRKPDMFFPAPDYRQRILT